ncbi:MAG: pirin family protein [Thermodesulfobacteriota bacterium]
MERTRKIRKVIRGRPVLEGAGVRLTRLFGFDRGSEFDPFLLLDDFRADDPRDYLKGFPWHPHRGIETITYILDGRVEHGDSMGNRGEIGPGDVQWMTAGSGIIHQEMPKGDERGRMGGFQLWANLPASHKMMDPRYRDVKSGQIPTVRAKNGAEVRVICGEVGMTRGPVRDIVTDPEYLDVTVPAGEGFTRRTRPGHTVFAYVIGGRGRFGGEKDPFSYEVEGSSYFDIARSLFAADGDLVLFSDGDRIEVSTETEPIRFLLLAGKPIGEPVAWYGPIVMNTQEELRIAFEEYENGTFIKHQRA